MDLLPNTHYTGSIETVPTIASHYKRYVIPVATGFTMQGPFGVILSQEINFDIFILRYYVLLINEVSNFYMAVPRALLSLCYMLENQISFHIKRHQKGIVLGEGQFQLLGLPPDRYDIVLEAGTYRLCQLDVKEEHLPELSSKYTSVDAVMHKANKGQPVVYGEDPLGISIQALLLLQDIIIVTDPGILGRMTIESNAKKLLLLSLDELETQSKTSRITSSDKCEHEKIKAFIRANLDNKLTTESLCRHFKIGKTKLQQSFVQLSGKSVHDFITDQRIDAAKLLLRTNMPINEVAFKMGYVETSNFIRMFKRVTEMTPMEYRNSSGHFDY